MLMAPRQLVVQHGIPAQMRPRRRRLSSAVRGVCPVMFMPARLRWCQLHLRLGSVEGGRCGLLHGIHMPLVPRFVLAVLARTQFVRSTGKGKQFESDFLMDGIRQFAGGFGMLQPSETAVTLSSSNLSRVVGVHVPCQDERKSRIASMLSLVSVLRLNAILFDVKRRFPSAPCATGHIQATEAKSSRVVNGEHRIHGRKQFLDEGFPIFLSTYVSRRSVSTTSRKRDGVLEVVQPAQPRTFIASSCAPSADSRPNTPFLTISAARSACSRMKAVSVACSNLFVLEVVSGYRP